MSTIEGKAIPGNTWATFNYEIGQEAIKGQNYEVQGDDTERHPSKEKRT